MDDQNCLFCQIVARQIPATIVAETETTLTFRDVNPQAPTHLLVIPKIHAATMAALLSADPNVVMDVMQSAVDAADAAGVSASGYRLVVNTGSDGGQTVDHVHVHVLGGRPLAWPPG
jgi:histidine triad (HIT) family protein